MNDDDVKIKVYQPKKRGRVRVGKTFISEWCLRSVTTAVVTVLLLAPTPQALQPITSLFGRRSSITRRHMVLNTPESIIEQASTQHLLDYLIDESVRTSARRPIMMQFDPSSGWIWKRWKGTIFSETWDSCVAKMIYACLVFILCRTYPNTVKETLSGFNILWGQLLSVTTFTLTFFVNQSYALWRKCYDLSRRLQGRLHDMDMTLAVHAVRQQGSDPYAPTKYTKESRKLLQVVARWVRLFNLLTYASFTRSHRPILTPMGMRRLVERGLMTAEERVILTESKLPATQRHNAVLLWIMRAFVEGREAGLFTGGAGFEDQFLEKAHVTRASFGAIGDELHGRMPLAYTHIVQVLVDLVLWMYPLMAFSSGMSGLLCVLGTGLLTIGYQGLFDLAKQFLDPYDNESYGKGDDPLVVDTLIAESNAGSVRWMHSLDQFPISSARVKSGMLDESIFPLRGYSVQELEQMEEERQKKEIEQRELFERQQEEMRIAEEHEQMVRQAAAEMTNYRLTSAQAKSMKHLTENSTISVEASRGVRVTRRIALPGAYATANLESCSDLVQFLSDASRLEGALPVTLIPPETTAPTPDDLACMNDENYSFFLYGNQNTSSLNDQSQDRSNRTSSADLLNRTPNFTGIENRESVLTPLNDLVPAVQSPGRALTIAGQSAKSIPSDNFSALKGIKSSRYRFLPDVEQSEFPNYVSGVPQTSTWERNDNRFDDNSPTTVSYSTKEKNAMPSSIFAYEEYERHIKAILQAARDEMIETEAIMNAPPGADSLEIFQTNELLVDGNSYDDDYMEPEQQLSSGNTISDFIVPAQSKDELTTEQGSLDEACLPVNASSDSIRTFADSWEEREQLLRSPSDRTASEILYNTTSLDSISQSMKSSESVNGISDPPAVPLNGEKKEKSKVKSNLKKDIDEVSEHTEQSKEIMTQEEIDELIETQAILNAPCAADSLDLPEEGKFNLISNTTQADDDFLSALEMDSPAPAAVLTGNRPTNETETSEIVHQGDDEQASVSTGENAE